MSALEKLQQTYERLRLLSREKRALKLAPEEEQGSTSETRSSETEAYLKKFIAERRAVQKTLTTLLHSSIRKLDQIEDEQVRANLRAELYKSVLPHEVNEIYTRSGGRAPLSGCVSFRQLLAIRSARGHVGGVNHEWRVNNKVKASEYVKQLGIPIPEYHGTFQLDDLPNLDGKVLKPLSGAGSKGVYLIANNKFLDVKRRQLLESFNELYEAAKYLNKQDWVVEELVSGKPDTPHPARDLKFYTFYGKVVLVLEVERYPETRYCWWDGDMQAVETGKYGQRLFNGDGFSPEDKAMAEKISLSIPAPFCRIDLLKGYEKTVFGEITPRPGTFERFSDEMDYQLGKEFLLAESRLQQTLLKNADFHPIFE